MKKTCVTLSIVSILTACGGGSNDNNNSGKPNGAALDPKQQVVLQKTAKGHIVPGYQALNNAVQQLSSNIDGFCEKEKPTQTDLQQTQSAWKKANQSWQAVQHIQLGPVKKVGNEISYWGDPGFTTRSSKTIAKGLNDLIKNIESGEALALEKVHSYLQGLPALEHLLFSQSTAMVSSSDQKARCTLAKGYGERLQAHSTYLVAKWLPENKDYYSEYVYEKEGDFYSTQVALNTTVNDLIVTIELMKDRKLKRIMNDSELVENLGSATSIQSVKTNISALIDFYRSGLKAFVATEKNHPEIANKFDKKLVEIQNEVAKLSDAQVIDSSSKATIQSSIALLQELRLLLETELAPAAELTMTFNSTDGD
ncbi:imelysin family protein [Algicola sagamiensis]|uniref:imelysin family protein n=1 Tax=Algicola sagamiensis TaxID=163869 RepID=UPI000374A955|nr:imelysin family protein [Algicola sagamiensis]